MRFAVLADIHANLPALNAVLEDIQGQNVDGIILAGDFLTGGPAPKQVFDLVRANVDWTILGNADRRLLEYADHQMLEPWRLNEQWSSLHWTYEQFSSVDYEALNRYPESLVIVLNEEALIHVVHGSPRFIEEHIVPEHNAAIMELFKEAGLLYNQNIEVAHVMKLIDEPVLVCGHSHIPWQYEVGERLVVNPGSVGAPVDGDNRAHYMLLQREVQGWRVIPRRIAYDMEWQRRLYRESGFLYEGGGMAWAFLLSVETGRNVLGDFILAVRNVAVQEGWVEERTYPDHIWGRAIEAYDWD